MRATASRASSMAAGNTRRARSPAFYEADLLPVVNAQLQKAGLRLAAVLDASLK